MITIFTFIIILFTISVLSNRLYLSYKKDPDNKLTLYFFWGLVLSSIGQVFNLILISLYYLIQNQNLLLWSDIVGRLFIFLGAAALIQMPLYLFAPYSKYRIYVSYLIVMYGLVFFGYNMSLDYHPYFEGGIINWDAPLSMTYFFGIPTSLIYGATVTIFFMEFFRSGFKSKKSLLFGMGFLLGTATAVAQDFAKNSFQYILVYIIMALSFVLAYCGLLIERKPQKNIKKTAP